MANTTLRTYLNDLNLLLEQEALEEVIGHCRHILQHFPKNVDTYRVLGQALLARGRNEEAQEVFRRVLGAVPDDLIGHLGMSKATELSNINESVWHMERALEQQPHNLALRDDLRNLINTRDGSAPDQLRLTKGGLARLYLSSRLYAQAVPMLQSALSETPDRIDLMVLLAQAYWDNGFEAEAGETALKVLDRQPDCIEANQIMSRLWLQHGRASDAQPYLSRLERLDPFTAWSVLHPDGKQPPENAFALPQLKWDARAAAQLATDVPDWVSDIGQVFETPELFSPSGPAFSSSQTDATGTFTLPVGSSDPFGSPLSRRTSSTGPLPAQVPDAEPDWFKDIVAEAPSPSVSSQVADWLAEEEESFLSETEDSEALDPLAWMNTRTLDAHEVESEPIVSEIPAADPMAWLQTGTLDAGVVESEPVVSEIPAADPMAWLQTGTLDAGVVESEPAVSEIPAADPMAWLQTGTLDAGVVESEPAAPTMAEVGADQDLSVDWLLGDIPEPQGEADDQFGVDFLLGGEQVGTPERVMPADSSGELDLDWSQLEQTQTPIVPTEAAEMQWDAEAWSAGSEDVLHSGAAEPEIVSSEWAQSDDFAAALASEIGMGLDTPDIEVASAEETAAALEGLIDNGSFDLSTLNLGETAPNASEDLTPDWLRGAQIEISEPSATAETGFEPTPETITGGEFDWLNTTFEIPSGAASAEVPMAEMPSTFESTEEDDLQLDWLATEELSLPGGLGETAQGDDLDWMAAPESTALVPETNLEAHFEMPEFDQVEPQTEEQPNQFEFMELPPAEPQLDPMSWLTQFQATGEVSTESVPAPNLEEASPESLFEESNDAAQFMAALMAQPDLPEQPETALTDGTSESESPTWMQPTLESTGPAGLDWMQPTDQKPEIKDDEWFSALEVVESPMEKPPVANITTSQFAQMFEDVPAAITPASTEPAIEDDWLAAFETEESSTTTPVGFSPAPAPISESSEMDIAAMFESASPEPEVLSPEISSAVGEVSLPTVEITPPSEDETIVESEEEPKSVPLYKRKVTSNLPRMSTTSGWTDVGPTPTEETPSWMLEGDLFAPPSGETAAVDQNEAQTHFEELIRQTADRSSKPPVTGELVGDVPTLDSPEWLSGLSTDDMAAAFPTATPEALAGEASPIDLESLFSPEESDQSGFDFSMEEVEAPTAEETAAGAVPDWLLQMAPGGSAEPDKRDTMPLESLDFGNLDEAADLAGELFGDGLTTSTASQTPPAEPPPEEDEGEFKFKKAPAWKRKK